MVTTIVSHGVVGVVLLAVWKEKLFESQRSVHKFRKLHESGPSRAKDSEECFVI